VRTRGVPSENIVTNGRRRYIAYLKAKVRKLEKLNKKRQGFDNVTAGLGFFRELAPNFEQNG